MKKVLGLLMVLLLITMCIVSCGLGTEEGEKHITVIVGEDTYEVNTDAVYIDQVLSELDFNVDIKDGFINSIGDIKPGEREFVCVMTTIEDPMVSWTEMSKEVDGKTFYSSNYGVGSLPVKDGETYLFCLETW